MEGEKEFFRKRFFGGFNREDVIKYIAKIAGERNEALAAKEKAEKELSEIRTAQEKADHDARALAEEVKKLRDEKKAQTSNAAQAVKTEEAQTAAEEKPAEEKPAEKKPDKIFEEKPIKTCVKIKRRKQEG